MRIDFVSDVACPWCAVGLHALERALQRIGPALTVELHFQPFELNPQMEAEGADAVQYLTQKYGLTREQIARNEATIRERGAAVGFAFGTRSRVWNTFDAHRLLAWAGTLGGDGQRRLKHALLEAYHAQGRNPGDRAVLLELAAGLGLDAAEAAQALDGDRFSTEVRTLEQQWQEAGIQAVPSVIVEGRHLIQGGQPPEVFEQALRQLAGLEGTAQ